MAYSNVWSDTFPPDTQAAKLLGSDIRALKVDVRERLGTFFSGTFAARPTPEAAWTGLMYFATDTNQIFRWNGSAWIDVTANFNSQIALSLDTVGHTPVNVGGATAPTAGQILVATTPTTARWLNQNLITKEHIFADFTAPSGFDVWNVPSTYTLIGARVRLLHTDPTGNATIDFYKNGSSLQAGIPYNFGGVQDWVDISGLVDHAVFNDGDSLFMAIVAVSGHCDYVIGEAIFRPGA